MSICRAVETFITNFNININLKDVHFRQFNVTPYNIQPQSHQFGEKMCLLYQIDLTVFNVEIFLRILAFKYDNHAEVLKLEIKIYNELLSREIAPCKNFLQRKRNMNLAFEVLIKFASMFEMRRLICQTVFQKQGNISTISEDDKIFVKYCNEDFSITYLELNWTISWNVERYEVSDFIEFFFNSSVLKTDCADTVRQKLKVLVEPSMAFHSKLKLWKSIIQDLYGSFSPQDSRKTVTGSTDVLEILDSDSDESDVIEVSDSIYHEPGNTGNDEVLVIE